MGLLQTIRFAFQRLRGRPAMQCTHLDQIHDVTPSSTGCQQCLELGDTWVHLRMCMTDGQVGCCDSSQNKHASRHAREHAPGASDRSIDGAGRGLALVLHRRDAGAATASEGCSKDARGRDSQHGATGAARRRQRSRHPCRHRSRPHPPVSRPTAAAAGDSAGATP